MIRYFVNQSRAFSFVLYEDSVKLKTYSVLGRFLKIFVIEFENIKNEDY